ESRPCGGTKRCQSSQPSPAWFARCEEQLPLANRSECSVGLYQLLAIPALSGSWRNDQTPSRDTRFVCAEEELPGLIVVLVAAFAAAVGRATPKVKEDPVFRKSRRVFTGTLTYTIA